MGRGRCILETGTSAEKRMDDTDGMCEKGGLAQGMGVFGGWDGGVCGGA